MQHMIAGMNIGLIASKQTRDHWNVYASRHIIGHKAVAAYDINSMFPLYIYPDDTPRDSLFDGACNSDHCVTNLAAAFITDFTARLGMTFIPSGKGDRIQSFGPEDVFDYMYAVFHSPAYRERYAEFLKIDFPRLPLTSNIELFRSLCEIGGRLVALHLMETPIHLMTSYSVAGNNTVEAVRFSAPGEGSEMGRVWINKTQYFKGVPPEVWAFQVGGYQVCQKWLKDRKGRLLTYDDISHYQRIVVVLAETIRLMAAVNEAIAARGGWPIG